MLIHWLSNRLNDIAWANPLKLLKRDPLVTKPDDSEPTANSFAILGTLVSKPSLYNDALAKITNSCRLICNKNQLLATTLNWKLDGHFKRLRQNQKHCCSPHLNWMFLWEGEESLPILTQHCWPGDEWEPKLFSAAISQINPKQEWKDQSQDVRYLFQECKSQKEFRLIWQVDVEYRSTIGWHWVQDSW